MNQNSTGDRQPVENLAVGDHISDSAGVHRVMHHFGFRDGDGRRMRAVTLQPLSKGQPWMAKVHEGHPFHLATEDEICEFADTRRRAQFHDDLVALQGLLGALSVRISAHIGDQMRIALVDGEVSRLAEKLGLPLEPFGYPDSPNQCIEWVAPGDEDRGDRLEVRFWGKPAPEPVQPEAAGKFTVTPIEVEQDWYFTFGAASQYADRYVRIRGTEHSAAKRMNLVFGHAWDQYRSTVGFDSWKLTELPESEWPPSPNDELVQAVDKAFLPTRDEQQGR